MGESSDKRPLISNSCQIIQIMVSQPTTAALPRDSLSHVLPKWFRVARLWYTGAKSVVRVPWRRSKATTPCEFCNCIASASVPHGARPRLHRSHLNASWQSCGGLDKASNLLMHCLPQKFGLATRGKHIYVWSHTFASVLSLQLLCYR